MSRHRSRRDALAAFFAVAPLLAAAISGCGDSVPNQRTSGTLMVPLDSVEKADEIEAKKREALAPRKGRKKGGN